MQSILFTEIGISNVGYDSLNISFRYVIILSVIFSSHYEGVIKICYMIHKVHKIKAKHFLRGSTTFNENEMRETFPQWFQLRRHCDTQTTISSPTICKWSTKIHRDSFLKYSLNIGQWSCTRVQMNNIL